MEIFIVPTLIQFHYKLDKALRTSIVKFYNYVEEKQF